MKFLHFAAGIVEIIPCPRQQASDKKIGLYEEEGTPAKISRVRMNSNTNRARRTVCYFSMNWSSGFMSRETLKFCT
jgi:hypothetical protein